MTTKQRLQAFIEKYNGQRNVGNTPGNTGQCTGLVMVWLMGELDLPRVWGDAHNLLKNAHKSVYDVLINTPEFVPQAGDVVVWNIGFNGTAGHTAICTGTGSTRSFEVFEQNNPLGSGCRLHTHNYNYVDGFLRAKTTSISPAPSDNLDFILDGKLDISNPVKKDHFAQFLGYTGWQDYQNFINRPIEAKNQEINVLINQIEELHRLLLNQQPIEVVKEVKVFTSNLADLSSAQFLDLVVKEVGRRISG